MFPGSGKVDRNSNAKQLAINLFPEIISVIGDSFASFRYDKRGVGQSEGDFYSTGLEDLFIDAEAAVNWLKTREEIDPERVFVLGHSEGALVALRLATKESFVAGAVLLAGPAKAGEETLIWQGEKVSETITGFNKFLLKLLRIDIQKSQQKTLEKIKASNKDSFRIQGQKINAKWMREFISHDPKGDLKKTRVPVLAITGSNDIQVDPKDLQTMKSMASAEIEIHEIAGLTHLLREDYGNKGLQGYRKQVKQPVDQRVMEKLSEWLLKKSL
jgi:pimeloyl-ACP methyl ester carboxylesterase